MGFLATLGMLRKSGPLHDFVSTCERLGERPSEETRNVPDWFARMINRTIPHYELNARYTLYATMFSGVLTGWYSVSVVGGPEGI